MSRGRIETKRNWREREGRRKKTDRSWKNREDTKLNEGDWRKRSRSSEKRWSAYNGKSWNERE